MAKRHLRLHEPRWKLGLVINGIGACATALVLVVISVTKFTHGAWAVMVLVPLMVWLLVRMNHQYEREHAELERGVSAFMPTSTRRDAPTVILVVDDVDTKTVHALQYVRTLRAGRVVAVHLEDESEDTRGASKPRGHSPGSARSPCGSYGAEGMRRTGSPGSSGASTTTET